MLDGITHQIGYDLREAVRIDRSHWHGPFCLVDLQSKDLGQQECIVADEGNMHLWFISDDVKRTTKKLQSLGLKATNDTVLSPAAWRHILLNGHYTFQSGGKMIDLDALLAGLELG